MDASDVTLLVTIVVFIFDIIIRIAALFIVPRNRKPGSATAWLLLIMFIPFLGAIFFLLIGYTHLPKRRREKQREINTFILDTTEGMDRVIREPHRPAWLESVVELNRTLGAMPLVGGNTARLLGDYTASIAEMTAAVRAAKKYVHAQFYIFSRDSTTEEFFDALADARKRGLVVRVTMDHIASLQYPGYRKTKKFLTENDIEWRLLLPVQPWKGKYQRPDLRNHRKLLVVDGNVAFMGSQNMIDRSYNRAKNRQRGLQWQDLMIRVRGPIVAGINAIFITDWYAETGELLTREADPITDEDDPAKYDCQVVPSGPGFDGENNLRLFNALLYSAQEKIIITSPYFVPDESMLMAITTAVQRGIEVQLFVSEIGDQVLVYHAQRSYYEALLQVGVVIWMYKAPYILHAKHFTIDDDVAVIGSSNMDIRSFNLNLEMSLMIPDPRFVQQMRQVEADYRANSRELTLDEWHKEPWHRTIVDNLARLTSALQ
ncbi:MAG: cardiolipin synthase [Naasia sp.]